jgi:hypothetical protein
VECKGCEESLCFRLVPIVLLRDKFVKAMQIKSQPHSRPFKGNIIGRDWVMHKIVNIEMRPVACELQTISRHSDHSKGIKF